MIKHAIYGGGAATTAGDFGMALLRVSVGTFIAYHGFQKFPPPDQFVEMTTNFGFPQPHLFAWLSVITESIGGILLAVGFLTRFVSVALVFNMGVAAFVALAAAKWFAQGVPSKEMPMMYLFPFLMFVFTGAGQFSLDGFLRGGRPVVVEGRETVIEPTRRVV